jgi:preprotein translocase subunit SecD
MPSSPGAFVPLFTGDEIVAVRATRDPVTDELGLDVELTARGADLLDEYAAEHIGDSLAVVLDGIIVLLRTLGANRYDGRMWVLFDHDNPVEVRRMAAKLTSAEWPFPVQVALEPCGD